MADQQTRLTLSDEELMLIRTTALRLALKAHPLSVDDHGRYLADAERSERVLSTASRFASFVEGKPDA